MNRLLFLCFIFWKCPTIANAQDYQSAHFINPSDQTEILFLTRIVMKSEGREAFHELINSFLQTQAIGSTAPSAIFIAELAQSPLAMGQNNEILRNSTRRPASKSIPITIIPIDAKSTSVMSIGAAVIKSAVGTFYYFHFLPFDAALIGSVFSSVHSLIFTSFPLAERALLFDPIKQMLNIRKDDDSKKARTVDLVISAVHKLFNLAVVTSIINWPSLDAIEILKDAGASALIYSVIKNLWKINLDYRVRAGKLQQKSYFFATSSLELAAWSLMPAIMLDQPWAIALGAGMAATGLLSNAVNNRRFLPGTAFQCEALLGSIR